MTDVERLLIVAPVGIFIEQSAVYVKTFPDFFTGEIRQPLFSSFAFIVFMSSVGLVHLVASIFFPLTVR